MGCGARSEAGRSNRMLGSSHFHALADKCGRLRRGKCERNDSAARCFYDNVDNVLFIEAGSDTGNILKTVVASSKECQYRPIASIPEAQTTSSDLCLPQRRQQPIADKHCSDVQN